MSSFVVRFGAFFVGTVGGLGFVPKIPGTIGSLVALVLLPIVHAFVFGSDLRLTLGFLGLVGLVGTMASQWIASHSQESDPSFVVIDEVVGMSIALVPMLLSGRDGRTFLGSLLGYGLGFVLFRVLDIAKPGPIRQLEALKGGVGIMADDVAAGIVVALVLFALTQFGLLR